MVDVHSIPIFDRRGGCCSVGLKASSDLQKGLNGLPAMEARRFLSRFSSFAVLHWRLRALGW